ncbi:hypothetical protein SAMN05216474_2414 [Lishizhenia tianjinensis]|uniref:Uncharacterized protein n=1 Tax=Lishizhenia tianjinensis TaxID=477690 RepID=A0A1I7AZF4_9FLAO|nr:hypothetical protein [Lishizhenia tianjinensis]SFT80262.1 hypothetical protein SAMN05216474_2414 [Lishizhenia tianjinensis]
MSETTENNPIPNQGNENKPKGAIWIIVAIAALIGIAVMGVMYSGQKSAKEECQVANAQLEQEMKAMNDALSGYIDITTSDLKQDFQTMLDTYDEMVEFDASLKDSIDIQKARIESLMEDLKTNKRRSYREINKLKTENQTLRKIMKGYLVQIDSLNTLTGTLSNRLVETESRLSTTEQERDLYAQTAAQNEQLVKEGSKLSAYNFKTYAYRYTINGSPDETNRAKRADGVKSEFTLGENKIAMAGNKMVYMQVIDPNGKVIYAKANNTFDANGTTLIYTDKREINYQQKEIDMAVVHNLQGRELEKGNYTVKIFADGAVIGTDSFTLK